MDTQPRLRRRRWTAEEVIALGVSTDIETAGSVLGMGRSKTRTLIRTGDFPVPVVRVGARYVVPTAGLLDLLNVRSDRMSA